MFASSTIRGRGFYIEGIICINQNYVRVNDLMKKSQISHITSQYSFKMSVAGYILTIPRARVWSHSMPCKEAIILIL